MSHLENCSCHVVRAVVFAVICTHSPRKSKLRKKSAFIQGSTGTGTRSYHIVYIRSESLFLKNLDVFNLHNFREVTSVKHPLPPLPYKNKK
jgi:hypothetical protein